MFAIILFSVTQKLSFIFVTIALSISVKGSSCFNSNECSVWEIHQLVDGIHAGKRSFIIYGDIDLSQRTFAFPSPSTIRFKGGKLRNGKLKGQFTVLGIKKGSLSVIFVDGASISNRIPVYSNNVTTDASLISACLGGCDIREDIKVEDAVILRSSINGNGHTICRTSDGNATIFIEDYDDGISINNLTIVKEFEKGTINQNYAIYCINSSNIHFVDCRIVGRVYFVNRTRSDNPEMISNNVSITRSRLECDLSDSPQGFQNGQDHLTFCSIKDIVISNCDILSRNVNRVIKTTAFFPEDKYEKVVNCCDGILFNNNKCIAECENGKQFWDFFCGTVNVSIKNNVFDLIGFIDVFENKAYQDKYKGEELIRSTISICNNKIRSKHSSLFQFCASPSCDSFVFQGNECHIYGTNLNPYSGFNRSSGSYLQGYNSCLIKNNQFFWEDEASGLMFTTLNFDCRNTQIENNYFYNVYRVNVASSNRGDLNRVCPVIESFIYRNNKKEYNAQYHSPQIEVAFEGVRAKNVTIEIDNENSRDYSVSVNSDSQIENLRFRSSRQNEKAICVLSDRASIKILDLPKNAIKRGNNWLIGQQ